MSSCINFCVKRSTIALPKPQPCHFGHTTTSHIVALNTPSEVHRAKP